MASTLLLLASLVIGCTAQIRENTAWSPILPGQPHAPETLQMWTFHTGPEAVKVQAVLDRLHRDYPWLTVRLVPGKEDWDILQSIYSGMPPDVAVLAGPANVGKACATGAFADLVRVGHADGVDIPAMIPAPLLETATYQHETCALPWLTDAFALYYNTALFAEAGIDRPPRSLAELQADARKLTTYNADGSIKVAGFVPLSTFYHSEHMDQGPTFQAPWYRPDGKSALGDDPRWLAGLSWHKKFVDEMGYQKLQRFASQIGSDSEYTEANAFHTGQVAMILDGEWRQFQMAEQHANVPYAIAPFPTLDPADYGAGQIGGTMISYPATARDPAASWLVVKYLALDFGAIDQLATDLQNIPTTNATLEHSRYARDPMHKTFIDITRNPKSLWKTPITAGEADLQLLETYVQTMESEPANHIPAGLRELAGHIDAELEVN
ncbi:MAG TPA: extracellular solute-binding protein [Pseudonocardia sp.]